MNHSDCSYSPLEIAKAKGQPEKSISYADLISQREKLLKVVRKSSQGGSAPL